MSNTATDTMKQLIIERLKQGCSLKDISEELSINTFIVAAVALSASK